MSDWINPQDYGASGDGKTHDTEAYSQTLPMGRAVWTPYTATRYLLDRAIPKKNRKD